MCHRSTSMAICSVSFFLIFGLIVETQKVSPLVRFYAHRQLRYRENFNKGFLFRVITCVSRIWSSNNAYNFALFR